jgi:large subunit ribosomal protein L21
MYAVVRTGGRQYRVEAGTTLVVEKLPGEPGSSVTFDRVLLVGDGDKVMVGTPIVAGAAVSATVLGQVLGEKIVVFKFKQKAKYRRRTGHRQHLTQLRIDEISAGGRTVRAEAPAVAEKPKGAIPKAARPKAAPAAAKPTSEAAPSGPAPSRGRAKAKAAADEEPATAPSGAEAPAKAAKAATRTRSRATADAAEKAPTPADDAAANAPRKPRTRKTTKPAAGAADAKAAEE